MFTPILIVKYAQMCIRDRVGEELVVVVMAGTRENFYDQLKRYIKG